MVGDGLHDIQSGNAAGALTCLVRHQWNLGAGDAADFSVESLTEIEGIIKAHSE